jgi:hypothetical protein
VSVKVIPPGSFLNGGRHGLDKPKGTMKRVFGWIFMGRLCRRCGEERTHRRFEDVSCDTCYAVTLLKALGLIQKLKMEEK